MRSLSRVTDRFCQLVNTNFGDNLEGVLQYGSSLYNEGSFTDLDIIVILKERINSCNDVLCLRKINGKLKKWNLDLQLIYLDEIVDSDFFSLDAHGSYFVEVLKSARTLFGKNPFVSLGAPGNHHISTVSQIQNYVFRARQEAMGMPKSFKDKSIFYHKKKIKNILNDILLLHGFSFEREYFRTLKLFQKSFHFFNKNQIKFLKTTNSNNVYDYIDYYNNLYSHTLRYIKKRYLTSPKIERKKHNGIVYEYANPSFHSKKLLILLDGLPSVPSRKNLIKALSAYGYKVVFPRYKGTWESEGEFLKENPALDINKFIKHLKISLPNIKQINLITTSFGGSVGLEVKSNLIHKAVHLSPVTDFSSIKTKLKGLDRHLVKFYGQAYRFKKENWKKLLSNGYLKPISQNTSKVDTLIIGGALDKTILKENLQTYCQNNNVPLLMYEELGHINFSDLEDNQKLLTRVIKFLNNE